MTDAMRRYREAQKRRQALAVGGSSEVEAADADAKLISAPTERSFGVALLASYIFILISRILDVSPLAFLHIPMILLAGLGLISVVVGDWQRAFNFKMTTFYLLFTAWVAICFPTSSWRGGSVSSVVLATESLGLYLIIVLLVRTPRDWRCIATAFAYAVLAAAVFSFFFGRTVDGRVALLSGTLGDPNEFALTLILGLPFWWFLAGQRPLFGKVFCFVATIPILVSFGRAGSRGGLLALVASLVVVLLFASAKQKILLCAFAGFILVAGAFLLPDYLKARFTTIFRSQNTGSLNAEMRGRLGSDIDSSNERQMLLQQSIRMTFEHPIFGVGPGVFSVTAWDERKAEGMYAGQMLVSHNTYTQISSELGIPGFLLFLTTFFMALKYTISDYKRLRNSAISDSYASLYTFATLSALGTGIFFLSVGYSFLLTTMFALAASLHGVLHSSEQAEFHQLPSLAPVSTPAVVPAAAPRRDAAVRFGRYADRN